MEEWNTAIETVDALRRAWDAGWWPAGTKVTGDGRKCLCLRLEATGERVWFEEAALVVTFKDSPYKV